MEAVSFGWYVFVVLGGRTVAVLVRMVCSLCASSVQAAVFGACGFIHSDGMGSMCIVRIVLNRCATFGWSEVYVPRPYKPPRSDGLEQVVRMV